MYIGIIFYHLDDISSSIRHFHYSLYLGCSNNKLFIYYGYCLDKIKNSLIILNLSPNIDLIYQKEEIETTKLIGYIKEVEMFNNQKILNMTEIFEYASLQKFEVDFHKNQP